MKNSFWIVTLILCSVMVLCCCSAEHGYIESDEKSSDADKPMETQSSETVADDVENANQNDIMAAYKSGEEKDNENTVHDEMKTEDQTISENSEADAEVNKYEKLIQDAFSGFDGKLSYGIHMYDSGYMNVYNNSQMKSASVIKLFIMEYAFELMKKGEINDDVVVAGSNISELVERMITVSDNNATNALIKYFGIDKIDGFVKEHYDATTLQRMMLDTAAAQRGEENYTSVADVMKFLDKLYNNRETYPYNEMLGIMKRQQISTKLRRNMPQGVKMASKTGELSDVENDVAIVFSDNGDYAIVCLTKGGSLATARNAMAKVCRSIYDALQKG